MDFTCFSTLLTNVLILYRRNHCRGGGPVGTTVRGVQVGTTAGGGPVGTTAGG